MQYQRPHRAFPIIHIICVPTTNLLPELQPPVCVCVCVCVCEKQKPGECCEVASEVMELDKLRLAVMLNWLWLVGG